jgi:hypothetical protein
MHGIKHWDVDIHLPDHIHEATELFIHFAHFQGNPRELPLYVCIRHVQQFVCQNMNYVMHMTEESQQIRLEKHMLSLSKSDSLVWQTRPSGFARQNQ